MPVCESARLLKLALAAVLSPVVAYGADISPINPPESTDYFSHARVMITGVIKRGDSKKLEQLMPGAIARSWARQPGEEAFPHIGISSPGGDVEEAMLMGRVLRKHLATLQVPKGGRCESACVLVLAGAATKLGFNVGIHRMRPTPEMAQRMGASKLTAHYNSMRLRVDDYLREMGVSPLLADMMLRTGSETMRYLSDRELDDLGLHGMDPGFAEYYRAKQVERYGETCVRRYDSFLQCLNRGEGKESCNASTGFYRFPCD
jgi:hypothetical protein